MANGERMSEEHVVKKLETCRIDEVLPSLGIIEDGRFITLWWCRKGWSNAWHL